MRKKPTAEEARRRTLMMNLVRELGITNASDLYEAMKDMFAGTLEAMLLGELEEPVGCEKASDRRDDAQVERKGRNDVSVIQEKVMLLYAKGLGTQDISRVIEDIYGFAISRETISQIVERVLPRSFEAWQSRPLEAVYAFVYVDAMAVKVGRDGKTCGKTVYSVLGVDLQGHKDVLGLWISENQNEDSSFWGMVFGELRARGVERMLFAVCVDGRCETEKGILSIFPQTQVQPCMVGLQRRSLRCIPTQQYGEFCRDTRAIYAAASLAAATRALEALRKKWREHPSAVRVWLDNFEQVERLFDLPAPVRHMVSTASTVEGLHFALRKVLRGKPAFSNDEAVGKALFLRIFDLTRKWSVSVPNWAMMGLEKIGNLFP